MKPFSLLLAATTVILGSCSTAKKDPSADRTAGLREILMIAEPIPASTIASLKAIANDPASLLPPEKNSGGEKPDAAAPSSDAAGEPSTASTPILDVRKEWRQPGINPDEVNPGDVFFENAGPILHKVLSLTDEMKPEERKAILDHFTISKTARVPVTFTKSELAGLKSETPDDVPLPTRSVALDYHSETHTLQGDAFLQLLENLERGESGGIAKSAKYQARLKRQIATMKKQLRSGERLFVVTGVVETDTLRASYPGAPLGSRDAALIRNAVAGLYPHLISLEAKKTGDTVELVAPPRILWEFDTREIKLEGDKLVIDFESVVRI